MTLGMNTTHLQNGAGPSVSDATLLEIQPKLRRFATSNGRCNSAGVSGTVTGVRLWVAPLIRISLGLRSSDFGIPLRPPSARTPAGPAALWAGNRAWRGSGF